MSIQDQHTVRVLLYEGSGSVALGAHRRFEVTRGLLERGYGLKVKAARGTEETLPGSRHTLLVLGSFEGREPASSVTEPAAGLGGGPGASGRVRFTDIAGLDQAGIEQAVEKVRSEATAARPGDWKPWFPVIDFDRCTNCMQCLSFCLFGVYGVDSNQKIQVQQSDSCKTNCPACSRVCPEAAIMFPKYKSGPINGDAVSDDDLNREKMKIDISALLGGDVYSLLRERSERAKSRFSKERDSDKALKERQRCLAVLAQLGKDVPPEVLMSLPSPDEIQRRAKEAMAKADSARGAQPGGAEGAVPT